jgi:hypothetical protein
MPQADLTAARATIAAVRGVVVDVARVELVFPT